MFRKVWLSIALVCEIGLASSLSVEFDGISQAGSNHPCHVEVKMEKGLVKSFQGKAFGYRDTINIGQCSDNQLCRNEVPLDTVLVDLNENKIDFENPLVFAKYQLNQYNVDGNPRLSGSIQSGNLIFEIDIEINESSFVFQNVARVPNFGLMFRESFTCLKTTLE